MACLAGSCQVLIIWSAAQLQLQLRLRPKKKVKKRTAIYRALFACKALPRLPQPQPQPLPVSQTLSLPLTLALPLHLPRSLPPTRQLFANSIYASDPNKISLRVPRCLYPCPYLYLTPAPVSVPALTSACVSNFCLDSYVGYGSKGLPFPLSLFMPPFLLDL